MQRVRNAASRIPAKAPAAPAASPAKRAAKRTPTSPAPKEPEKRAARAKAAPAAPAPAIPTPKPPVAVEARVAPVAPVASPLAVLVEAPVRPPVTFRAGDKAVHPAHGVGEVTAIEQRDIGGSKQMFYVLRILDNGMKVMVPTAAAAQVGLRCIMSAKDADAILTTMRAREVAVDVQPWSRRFRVYTEMIKSGSPVEVAKVLRDMNRLKFDKDLSFGERRLLDQAKSLLMKELAFAKRVPEVDMAEDVRRIFSA